MKTHVLLLIGAFFVGGIFASTVAYASGDKNGKPFEEIWKAIHVLENKQAEADILNTYLKTTKIVLPPNEIIDMKVGCDGEDKIISGYVQQSRLLGAIRDSNIWANHPVQEDGKISWHFHVQNDKASMELDLILICAEN